MEKERRKFKRIKASFPIRVLKTDADQGHGGVWEKGVTLNVSVKGALIRYGERNDFKVDSRVKIRLLIPRKYTDGFSDMTLRGNGRIVRGEKGKKQRLLAIEFDSSFKFGNFF